MGEKKWVRYGPGPAGGTPKPAALRRFAEGLDELWRTQLAPRLTGLVDLDAETARYLRQRYRRLYRRPGFRQLVRAHPRDAVQWYLDSVPGLTWTRR